MLLLLQGKTRKQSEIETSSPSKNFTNNPQGYRMIDLQRVFLTINRLILTFFAIHQRSTMTDVT